MSDLVNMTAGKVGPHRASSEPRLLAHLMLADGVVPVEGDFEVDVTNGMTNWGIDNNADYGCCGAAATDHNNMAKTGLEATYNTLGVPQFNGTLGTYCAYGFAMGEQANHSGCPDNGVDNASWFGYLYKMNIIKGYAQVERRYLSWFVQTFKGVVVGASVDGPTVQADFEATPRVAWPAMPNASDGHDTLIAITHVDRSGSLITWGGVQPYEAGFLDTNAQDFWVIFDEDDPNVNWAALTAALDDVHGVVAPASPVVVAPPSTTGVESKIVEDLHRDLHDLAKVIHSAVTQAVESEAESVIFDLLRAFVKEHL